MPDVKKLYYRNLSFQILKIVLVMFGFYALNTIASILVAVVYTMADPAFFQLMQQTVANGQTPSANTFMPLIQAAITRSLGASMIVGIIAGALLMFILRGKRLLTTDLTHVNRRIKLSDLFLVLVLMFGVQACTSFLAMIIEPLLNLIGMSLTGTYESSIDALLNVTGILYIVLIGPIVEEIIFRGAILRSLERYGVNFAIVLSSLLFAIYHIILFQAVFAFFLGILLAYIAQRYSIKWSMALHILNNGFSVAMSLVTNTTDTTSVVIMGVIILMLFVLALTGSIIILALNRRRLGAEIEQHRPTSMFYILGLVQPLPAFPAPYPQQMLFAGSLANSASQPYPSNQPPAMAGGAPLAPAAGEQPTPPTWGAPPMVSSPPPASWNPTAQPVAWAPSAPAGPPQGSGPQPASKDTGALTLPAASWEPQPHPFRVAFTNPLLLFALVLVLYLGITMMIL